MIANDDAGTARQIPLLPEGDSIERRFRRFHREHPEILERLLALVEKARHRGVRRLGIAQLWEVLRWEVTLEAGEGDDRYKLNNDYRSRYARLLMAVDRSLVDFFETRRLKAR